MNKVITQIGLALLLIVSLSACATVVASPSNSTAQSTPDLAVTQNKSNSTGGTMVRAMTSEPASIDPQGAASSGLSLVLPYLFDTLVVRDTSNKLVPFLADSWQVAVDGKAITFKLKSGVTFQDGTPFDAESVQFTFQRFKATGAKSPIYSGIQEIKDIQVVDPLTVRFVFDAPTADFWSTITMPYAGIISPASAQKVDAKKSGYLIGTGPFILDQWQAGQTLTLTRNPAYNWGAAVTSNRAAPFLDRMIFKVIPDASTQLAALETGAVDTIFVNAPEQRQKLQQDSNIQLDDAELNSLIYLAFNCKKAPFDDARVRRALSAAVNKSEILELALGGIGKVASTLLPPSLPGYDATLKSLEIGYDPKQAQSLLQQAGFAQSASGAWERGGKVLKGTLITSNRAPNDVIATLIQSQLKAIGVPVDIQQLDSKAVMQATADGTFDLLLYRYDWNDPNALEIYLGSSRIGSTNRAAYSNSQVDQLLKQGSQELDETKRIQLYVDAQKLIMQDAPWQPLYVPVDILAVDKRVSGVKIGFMGRMLVNDAQVKAR